MNIKTKLRSLVFVSFLIAISTLGVCYGGFKSICAPGVNEALAVFLLIFSSVIFLLSFIFLFAHEQKFNSWLHFSKYYLPIAAVLIFLSPAIDSSILGFDKEFMTWLLAGIFFVASLGIIIFSTRGGSLPTGQAGASGGKRHLKSIQKNQPR